MLESSDEEKSTEGYANESSGSPGANVPSEASTLSVMALASPISGRQFTIHRTSQVDEYEGELSQEIVLESNNLMTAPSFGDGYRGNDRMAAKLTIGSGPIQAFADMRELDEFLPPPEQMINHDPHIGTGPDSGRVEEEQQNVQVSAFLYAASRENDNDFHLIVGLNPSDSPNVCMNMEISGIPDTSNPHYDESGLPDPSDPDYAVTVQTLRSARDSFKEFFGGDVPGLGYDFYDPPIPVLIEGALFFDMTHSSGQKPGPQKLRPFIRTIWELHPITRIDFEP